MNILAISDFALVRHVHNENSELIGDLHIGDANGFNGHLYGVIRVNEYECDDFFYCNLGGENQIYGFFDALDDLLELSGAESFCFAFNCSKAWNGQFLKNVRKCFNANASIIFQEDEKLNNLKNNFNKQMFIDMYLKISQAFNFSKKGLIHFTNSNFF